MRARAVGSVGVVLAGLIPTMVGGPLFAALMLTLGIAGYREYVVLAGLAQRKSLPVNLYYAGVAGVAAFAAIAFLRFGEPALTLLVFGACAVPLLVSMFAGASESAFSSWALATAGTLYLGIPIYSAISLRADASPVSAAWVVGLTERLAFGWPAAPSGLAWTLVIVLATWVGDSAALLSGRRLGRRKLAPVLSPNKTVEGAIGGLIGSALVGAIVVQSCGLGNAWFGLLIGTAVGVVGQVGDLAESFLKRQAHVKDSGSLIPGHGGVLDRIDALLFAFPLGFAISALSSRWAW